MGFFPPRLEERFDGGAWPSTRFTSSRLEQVVHGDDGFSFEQLIKPTHTIFVAFLGLAGQEVLLEIPPSSVAVNPPPGGGWFISWESRNNLIALAHGQCLKLAFKL